MGSMVDMDFVGRMRRRRNGILGVVVMQRLGHIIETVMRKRPLDMLPPNDMRQTSIDMRRSTVDTIAVKARNAVRELVKA